MFAFHSFVGKADLGDKAVDSHGDQYNPPKFPSFTHPSTEMWPLEPDKWLVNFLKDQTASVHSFNIHQIFNK